MAEALDAAATIYEGIWTDWSKSNKAWGLTWTLCPEHAVLVTNALAVLVTLVGSQLWSISRFVLHQAGSRRGSKPSTPNHKKQQVILRNTNIDLATARLMSYLAWKLWRAQSRVSPRTISIAIFAFLHAILFMVAGTFSNLAISADDSTEGWFVLSRSPTCGVWNETYLGIVDAGNNVESEETLALSVEYIAKKSNNVQLSLEYAKKCYLSPDANDYMSSICKTLKKPRLDWTTRRNGTCPFEAQMCHRDSSVIVLDTGIIDSHDDLGINAASEDRLKYHRITQCMVLNDTDYILGWDGYVDPQEANKTSQAARAFFGRSLYKKTDWTYSYSNFASYFDNFSVQVTQPYQMDMEIAWARSDPQWSISEFEPIDELKLDSDDLSLLFLGFGGVYMDEINDPWFSAHQDESFSGVPEILSVRYSRDAAISTVACTERHQFCTHNDVCTPFGGFDQVQNDNEFNAALRPNANATFDRMLRAVTVGGIRSVVDGLSLSNTPLLANERVATGSFVISLGLPDDQWEREIYYWHAIAMAQIQQTIVQYATGQVAPRADQLLPPQSDQDKWFCQNLLIPSTVYQSFSILKIVLIVVFGVLIIVISLSIETLARWVRTCLRRESIEPDWDEDDMLKLRKDMRESMWKRSPRSTPRLGLGVRGSCHSTSPPPVPPKDIDRLPASLRHYYQTSPEVQTIRVVPNIITHSPPCDTRPSSPTLPLEDRHHRPGAAASEDCSKHLFVDANPNARAERDSWMAISLNGIEATTPAIPMEALHSDRSTRGPDSRPLYGPHSMMQRLRSPFNFHVPRPPGSWV